MKRMLIREHSEGMTFGRKRGGFGRRNCDALLMKGPADTMVELWSMG